jgi:biopolymer transport protein ExbD
MLTAAAMLSVLLAAMLHVHPAPQHVVRLDLSLPELDGSKRARIVVAIARDGTFAVDGVTCLNLIDLRMAMDLSQQRDIPPIIMLRVDPSARYETFVQVITVLKQSGVALLELGTGPSLAAIDGTDVPRTAGTLYKADLPLLEAPTLREIPHYERGCSHPASEWFQRRGISATS